MSVVLRERSSRSRQTRQKKVAPSSFQQMVARELGFPLPKLRGVCRVFCGVPRRLQVPLEQLITNEILNGVVLLGFTLDGHHMLSYTCTNASEIDTAPANGGGGISVGGGTGVDEFGYTYAAQLWRFPDRFQGRLLSHTRRRRTVSSLVCDERQRLRKVWEFTLFNSLKQPLSHSSLEITFHQTRGMPFTVVHGAYRSKSCVPEAFVTLIPRLVGPDGRITDRGVALGATRVRVCSFSYTVLKNPRAFVPDSSVLSRGGALVFDSGFGLEIVQVEPHEGGPEWVGKSFDGAVDDELKGSVRLASLDLEDDPTVKTPRVVRTASFSVEQYVAIMGPRIPLLKGALLIDYAMKVLRLVHADEASARDDRALLLVCCTFRRISRSGGIVKTEVQRTAELIGRTFHVVFELTVHLFRGTMCTLRVNGPLIHPSTSAHELIARLYAKRREQVRIPSHTRSITLSNRSVIERGTSVKAIFHPFLPVCVVVD